MRDPAPVPIQLKDYAPPAFLIDSVDLDVDLFEDHARVRSCLAISRNPKATDSKAPLVLDAEELEFESAALDGRKLAAGDYTLGEAHLTIAKAPARFVLETVCKTYPRKNTQLMGLYAAENGFFTQCEAERLPAHHLFHRPAGRDGQVHGDHPRQPRKISGAAFERQSRCKRRTKPAGATG